MKLPEKDKETEEETEKQERERPKEESDEKVEKESTKSVAADSTKEEKKEDKFEKESSATKLKMKGKEKQTEEKEKEKKESESATEKSDEEKSTKNQIHTEKLGKVQKIKPRDELSLAFKRKLEEVKPVRESEDEDESDDDKAKDLPTVVKTSKPGQVKKIKRSHANEVSKLRSANAISSSLSSSQLEKEESRAGKRKLRSPESCINERKFPKKESEEECPSDEEESEPLSPIPKKVEIRSEKFVESRSDVWQRVDSTPVVERREPVERFVG